MEDLKMYLGYLLKEHSKEWLQRESPLFRDHWDKIITFLAASL